MLDNNVQENYIIPEGAFGGRVSTDIVNQINARSKIRKKDNKSTKELSYLTSNSPWIMLRSGVNTARGSEETPNATISKNYVLTGGTLAESENGFEQSSGVEPFSARPAYTGGSMGFRPKPGITGIEVKTKDTWGCIMEASVKFTVWSLEDLEDIDKLYFKPGMTALLEWGHSMYVDNEGNVKTAEARTLVVPNSVFFDRSCTFEEIDNIIQKNRKACYGNYEGVFGYITNFSYSFRKDGGYDCSVTILSKGTVLEGLKIPCSKKGDTTGSIVRSKFHDILEDFKIRYDSVTSKGTVNSIYGIAYPRTVLKWGKNVTLFYVRLDDLLEIVNMVNSPSTYNENRILEIRKNYSTVYSSPDYSRPPALFKTGETYRKYVRFNEEFSLNPYIVILPQSSDFNLFTENSAKSWTIKPVLPSVTEHTDNNIIGDLLVNYNYFVELVDELIDNRIDDFREVNVIRPLLNNIQKALGNINSFGLSYNHVHNEWTVIDRNCVNDVDPCPAITVSGPGATIREFTVKSEISPEIVNTMSIAATSPVIGKDGGKVEAEASVTSWNEGSKNRHRVSRKEIEENNAQLNNDDYVETVDSGDTEGNGKEEELKPLGIWYDRKAFEKFMNDLTDIYKKFSSGSNFRWKQPGDAAEAAYSQLQLTAESLYARYVNRDIGNRKTVGSLQTGIIPVKLSLSLDGIGRMVIGSSFKISPGILPKKYDNWGYLITGINNTVSKQGWTTTLETQYFPIYNNVKKEPVAALQSGIEESKSSVNYTLKQAQEKVGVLRESNDQCANFTGRIAAIWQTGVDPVHVGGNADTSAYTNFLCKHGYRVHKSSIVRERTAMFAFGRENHQDGVVIQYYTLNHNSVTGGKKHMHSCIRVGGTWYSDFKQNSPCVYDDPTLYDWRYIVLYPKDWKELGNR